METTQKGWLNDFMERDMNKVLRNAVLIVGLNIAIIVGAVCISVPALNPTVTGKADTFDQRFGEWKQFGHGVWGPANFNP